VGEERIAAGQVDLAASSLLSTTTLTTTGTPELVRIPIGLDGLAIVVHPNNPITDLTVMNVQALFGGEILDWSELGSESGEVLLVSREDGSGSRRLFEERVMGDKAVSLTAVVMPSSADVLEFVSKNPPALGYISRAYVVAWLPDSTGTTSPGNGERQAVRVVPLEGQLPSVEHIKNQTYFLTQPLFLISRGQPQGEVRAFIDFVLSPAGQAIVERYHARLR
jgi:phosphate transport system substrate-binding protein